MSHASLGYSACVRTFLLSGKELERNYDDVVPALCVWIRIDQEGVSRVWKKEALRASGT